MQSPHDNAQSIVYVAHRSVYVQSQQSHQCNRSITHAIDIILGKGTKIWDSLEKCTPAMDYLMRQEAQLYHLGLLQCDIPVSSKTLKPEDRESNPR
jgi:K+/H+ antiporter YhaU regulatory subunit KhtT